MHGRLVLIAALAWCATASLVRIASAQAPAVVWVSKQDCPSLPLETIAALVGLELTPRAVRTKDATKDDYAQSDLRASLRCSDAQEERVLLRVQDAKGETRIALDLDLQPTARPARARLVALALAELIATSEMNIRASEERAQSPDAAAADPAQDSLDTADDAQTNATLKLWIAAGLARQGTPALLSPSLQGGGLLDLGPFWLILGLQTEWGTQQLSLAEASAWTASASGAAAIAFSLRPIDIVLGGGLIAGHVSLRGSSESPALEGRQLSGLWLGPLLTSAVHLVLSRGLSLRFALDAAYLLKAVRGFDGQGADLFAQDKLRLTVTLGALITL